ncbi:MOB kinase activator 1B [Mortierella alpina]|uniref:MOB kinase activator 1B n=1 Tax=Mortierella alpina TaxID=64518 RepID=A0A9P6M351_MORAP|nr:MOB kinase activator 1B [Mortierella alpina]
MNKTKPGIEQYCNKEGSSSKSKTAKKPSSGSSLQKQYLQKEYAQQTLGSGNLRLAVHLPEGEDLNEWLAVNTVDFFNQINMLYGTITEFCTPQDCPVMSAGPKYEYHWKDDSQFKKPARVSAPVYVDHLMSWVQSQLDNETIFPSKIGIEFPPQFKTIINDIFRRLFRVYAHIYTTHFPIIVSLGEEAHLNTSFKHFILFVKEFDLIDSKELAPLSDLIESLLAQTKNQ